MDILASGFKAVKHTSSHLASRGRALTSQLSQGFADTDEQAREGEVEAIPVTPDGPVLIQYIIQNGSPAEHEGSVFMLPDEAASGTITLGTVKSYFPIPGHFHFRFKSASELFSGFVWVDLLLDDEPVPQFAGGISMKVLRLPGDGDGRVPRGPGVSAPSFVPSPAPGRVKAPSRASAAELDLRMDDPTPTQEDIPRFASSDGWDSPPKAVQREVVQREVVQREVIPRQSVQRDVISRAPVEKEPVANVSPVQPAPQTQAPLSFDESPPPPPPAPPADLMEWDAFPSPSSSSTVPSPPPPAPQQFDRDQLVAQRESEVKNRVELASKENAQRQEDEERMRASKVQASNKLCTELDRWAKTPDGAAFKDIRSLLSTQHEVLWSDSGWKPVALSELIQDGAIKKAYRKAIIVVHPDKMKSAEPEKQVRADRIFQALNEGFKAYTANET